MRWILPLALVALCLAPAPAAAAEAGDAALSRRLAEVLDRSGVPEGEVGVAVLRMGARPGHVFTRSATRGLSPASVAKVLTAATALDLLGPGHRFTTRVTGRGTLEGGVLSGDLVVHGTGDPNLSGRFGHGGPTQVLERLALAVKAQGVREVRGALVLDDGGFDRDYVHEGWTSSDKERWYGAPVSGLAFNDSCLEITVQPAESSARKALLELPATSGSWGVENLTTTVDGGRHAVYATWTTNHQALQVRGQVPLRAATASLQVPVPDPLAWFAGAFARVLRAQGIRLTGGARFAKDQSDRAPGRLLAEHASALPPTLNVMNRRSQNFYASQLFKACGVAASGRGTWKGGEAAVREMLRRRGIPTPEDTSILDGSGLAKASRTTAGTLALTLLDFDRDLMRGALLRESFAAPGEDGTLEQRLVTRHTRGRLRAKTGTLAQAGVHALAGYLEGAPGAPDLCFAILVNKRSWRGDPRGLIDDLVEALARP
jgi:serine-type D-Ala-D-Ala carboxypeptidase/endopeptidase (penicillin-binding protein 4)